MAEKSSDGSRAAGGQTTDRQPAEDEHEFTEDESHKPAGDEHELTEDERRKLAEDERRKLTEDGLKDTMEDEPRGKVSDNEEIKDKPPDTKGKGANKGKDQQKSAAEGGHHPTNNNEVPVESTEKVFKNKEMKDTPPDADGKGANKGKDEQRPAAEGEHRPTDNNEVPDESTEKVSHNKEMKDKPPDADCKGATKDKDQQKSAAEGEHRPTDNNEVPVSHNKEMKDKPLDADCKGATKDKDQQKSAAEGEHRPTDNNEVPVESTEKVSHYKEMKDKPPDADCKGATKDKDQQKSAAEGEHRPTDNNEVPVESTEKVSHNKEMKDKPPDADGGGHRPTNTDEVQDEPADKGNDAAMVATYVMVSANETGKVGKADNNTKDVHSNYPNVAASPTTVECKEQKETETSSTTIKEAPNKETLTVMKIGPLWTLFVNGKKLILPELKGAKTVTTEENYIIADEQVYEIKTGDNGHVFLEKFGTATVADRDSSSHASSSKGDNECKDHVRSGPEFNIKENKINSESHRCEKHECRDSQYEQEEDDSKSKKSKTISASTRPPPDKGANNQVSSNDKKLRKGSDPSPTTNSILGIHPEESKSGRNEDGHQTIDENIDAEMQKDTISEDIDGNLCEIFEKTLTLNSSERSIVTSNTNDPKQVADKRLLCSTHTPSSPAQKSPDFSRSTGTLNRTIMNEKNEFPINTTGMPSTYNEEINENKHVRFKQRANDGRNDNPETEDSTITSQHDCEVPALPPKSPKNNCATEILESEAPVPAQRRRGKKSMDIKQTPHETGGAAGDHLSQSGETEQKTPKEGEHQLNETLCPANSDAECGQLSHSGDQEHVDDKSGGKRSNETTTGDDRGQAEAGGVLPEQDFQDKKVRDLKQKEKTPGGTGDAAGDHLSQSGDVKQKTLKVDEKSDGKRSNEPTTRDDRGQAEAGGVVSEQDNQGGGFADSRPTVPGLHSSQRVDEGEAKHERPVDSGPTGLQSNQDINDMKGDLEHRETTLGVVSGAAGDHHSRSGDNQNTPTDAAIEKNGEKSRTDSTGSNGTGRELTPTPDNPLLANIPVDDKTGGKRSNEPTPHDDTGQAQGGGVLPRKDNQGQHTSGQPIPVQPTQGQPTQDKTSSAEIPDADKTRTDTVIIEFEAPDFEGKYKNRSITIVRMFDRECYLRWKFVLNSVTWFDQENDYGIDGSVTAESGKITIHLGKLETNPDCLNILNKVVEKVMANSDKLVVNGIPASEKVKDKDREFFMTSELGKKGEVYAECDENSNLVYIVYPKQIEGKVGTLTQSLKNRVMGKTKSQDVAAVELPPVFKEVFTTCLVDNQVKKKHPNIKMATSIDEAQNILKICLEGPKEDVNTVKQWIDQEFVQKYTCNEVSFKNIKHSDLFENISDMIEEYLSPGISGNCFININDVVRKIGICGTKHTDVDTLTNTIIKCIRKKEIKIEGKMATPDEKVELQEYLKRRYGSKVIVKECDSAFEVTSLKDVVEEIEKYINGRMKELNRKIPNSNVTDVVPVATIEPESTRHKKILSKIMHEIKNPDILSYLAGSQEIKKLCQKLCFEVVQTPRGFQIKAEASKFSQICDEIDDLVNKIKVENFEMTMDENKEAVIQSEAHKLERDNAVNIMTTNLDPVKHEAMGISKESTDVKAKDVNHVTWTFPEGHQIIVVNQDVQQCWKTLLVKIQPISEDSEQISTDIHDCSGKKRTTLYVPICEGGKNRDRLDERILSMLDKAKEYDCFDIAIPIQSVPNWQFVKFQKQIVWNLQKFMQCSGMAATRVFLCSQNTDLYRNCCNVCQEGCPEGVSEDSQTVQGQEDAPLDGIGVSIVIGSLNKTKADVIVNTTGQDFNLNTGAVSSSLLKSAGPELQDAVRRKLPHKAEFGDIIETNGYNLKGCKYVLHGALDVYKSDKDVKLLLDFVFNCLKKAAAFQCRSIAIPAIGTGNLKYPKDLVAEAMFNAVKQFDRAYRRKSSLQDVKFVIYHDAATIEQFRKQETKLQALRKRMQNGKLSVDLKLGSLATMERGCVIYILNKQAVTNQKMLEEDKFLKVVGDTVRREWRTRGASKHRYTPFVTKGGGSKARVIVHVPCEDKHTELIQAFRDGLILADEQEETSAYLYFHMQNSFLKHRTKLIDALFAAVKEVDEKLISLFGVTLVLDDDCKNNIHPSFYDYFNRISDPRITTNSKSQSIGVKIIGMPADVSKCKTCLLKLINSETSATKEEQMHIKKLPQSTVYPPLDQSIDRDGDEKGPSDLARQSSTTDGNWGRDNLREDKKLTCYVEIENISEGTTVSKLKSLLFSQKFPIPPPELVFSDGMVKAIVICQKENDAVKLSQCTGIQGLNFKHLRKQSLGSFTQKLDAKFLKVVHKKKEYDKLVDELLAIEVNLANGSIETQTSIQLQRVEAIVTSYGERLGLYPRKKTHSEFEVVAHSETVSRVSVLIWDVVRTVKDKEIKEIKSNNGSVEMDSQTSCITINILNTSGNDMAHAVVVKSFAEFIKNNDIDEIEIDAKDAADAPKWCKDIQETLTSTCSFCIFIPDDKKVVVCCETYDDILKIKHQLLIKQGKVKPTGRGGRHRRVLDSEPSTSDSRSSQQQSSDICSGKHSEFDWEREASLVEKYQTVEGITVCVYKASIVKLPVDCIVNAANATLQHGGGVAKVIADAAGHILTKEGDEYRRQYGDIAVGQVCSTTAGRLPYNCVIHAVGPRWYDYTPHTLVKVKQCEKDLYSAIYECFMEAERKNLISIALPAVSAAIFGVPEDFCVYHYAKATLDYSKRSSASSRLKEIHFIDINPNIIRKIQDAFEDMLQGQSDYDVQTFVKQQPSRRHNSPSRQYNYNENSDRYGRNKNMQGSQAVGGSNGASNYATNQGISSDEQNWPPASGISQLSVTPVSQDNEKYIVRFRNSGEPTLVLWRRNILNVKASAVVSVEDTKGSGYGKVAEMIAKKISSYKVSEYYSEKRRVFSQNTNIVLGDVLVTKGYDSGYGYIFHVVLAATVVERVMNKDRKKILGSAYDKILKHADDDENIESLVMPLVGTGAETKDEVKVSADAFIDSYSVFCNRKLQKSTSRPLTVYLVFRDKTNLSLVLSILEKQIRDSQLRPVTVPPRPSQLPQNYQLKMANESFGTDDDENCVICMDHITDPWKLDCGHMFCRECIDQQFKHKKVCPTCGKVCGIITGDQPDGSMQTYTNAYNCCEGYRDCSRIDIVYKFNNGHQGPNHPAPGKRYRGIERTAYLPDNYEGRQICEMLKVAFERKLVFTIGNSRTTGHEGVITWNDIHHKTNPKPYSEFGYPDETYLTRVKDELAAKGVTEDDIK